MNSTLISALGTLIYLVGTPGVTQAQEPNGSASPGVGLQPLFQEPWQSQQADREVEREMQERLREGRTDPSKTPGFLLDQLSMHFHRGDAPKREAAAREWLKVYPTASPDDRFFYANMCVWIAQGISDAQGSASDQSRHYRRSHPVHYPLSDLGRDIVSQSLDAQIHGHACDEQFIDTLQKLEQEKTVDPILREKISRVLRLPTTTTEKSLHSHLKELQTQVDLFGGERQENNVKLNVSKADQEKAQARLKILIPMISEEYRQCSSFERRAAAANVLNETCRLLRMKVKEAEPLFWQVEESVPVVWADNALICSIDFGSFYQQKDFKSLEKILLKLIAMEVFCEANMSNLAEEYVWLGETYITLGDRAKSDAAFESALALYRETEKEFKERSLQTDGISECIDRVTKLLKRS